MRQDRFLIGILVGIGALALLAVALFVARRGALDYGPDDTPAGVTRNFVVAIKKGDYDRAYGYLAEMENKPDTLAFRQTFQQFQASEVAATGVEIGAENVSGERAYVVVSMVRGGGGLFSDIYRDAQSAELVLENGEWKIKMMPYPFWNFSWSEPVKPEPVQ
jgi:hypothetical protein